MPPRKRAHSQSQSLSSAAVDTPSSPSPPPPKSVTTTRKPRRSSALPAPASSASAAPIISQHKPSLSTVLQFPLVVLLGFALSYLFFSLIAEFTVGDLAAVSKHSESWYEVAALLGWRVVEFAIYWFGGYDALDVASLSVLLSMPHALLLGFFYYIRPSTLILTTLANVAAITVPFVLSRSLSPSHHPHSVPKTVVRNKSILTDPWTVISTSLLATAIFAVLLESSFATFLPTFLITRFSRLRTLDFAHDGASGLPTLLVALLPMGFACTTFLFLPAAGVVKPYLQASTFDPATAGLAEHVLYNIWGWYSARQRELIRRTFVAGGLMMAECFIQGWGTIEGVEPSGAAGYGGLFATGLALVGIVYEWVGAPSG